MQLHPRLALVAAAAFVLPPLGAASQNVQPASPLVHRYVAGEHFVYDANTLINSAQLKAKRPGRYTVDVDAKDPSRATLRIQHDGKNNLPIAIAIKPDGTWARPDGRAVPAFATYDASRMCAHSGPLRAGESWDCHVDGVVQYLGGSVPDTGDVHVTVAKIVPPATVELRIAFRGQPSRSTVVDDANRNDVEVTQQTVRASDVVIENGIVTSMNDHSQIALAVGGSTSVMDVVSTKTLVEHRSK